MLKFIFVNPIYTGDEHDMENHPYAPAEIEPYWQAEWQKKEAFKIPNDIEIR